MRARNLKPGFFKNEYLAELDPLARILFAGLWCMADREGRLEYRPKRIKAEVLPYDNCDIEKMLKLLYDRGFIVCYPENQFQYIAIPGFRKHQNPHHRETESTIPAPDMPQESPGQAQDKPESSPELAQEQPGTSRADSPFPLPESPIHTRTVGMSEEERLIYDTWNNAGLIRHSNPKKFLPNIRSALRTYLAEDIIAAISNYRTVYHDDRFYWSYKWGLREFLLRGLDRFVPVNFNEKDYLKREGSNGNGSTGGPKGYGRHTPPGPEIDPEVIDTSKRLERGYRHARDAPEGEA